MKQIHLTKYVRLLLLLCRLKTQIYLFFSSLNKTFIIWDASIEVNLN